MIATLLIFIAYTVTELSYISLAAVSSHRASDGDIAPTAGDGDDTMSDTIITSKKHLNHSLLNLSTSSSSSDSSISSSDNEEERSSRPSQIPSSSFGSPKSSNYFQKRR